MDTVNVYGDVELKIINVRGIENKGRFWNIFGNNEQHNHIMANGVDVTICFDKCVIARATITRNGHSSDHEHQSSRVSLAHSLSRLRLEVRCELKDYVTYIGHASVPCSNLIAAGGLIEQWFPVIAKPGNRKNHIKVQLQVKFTPCHANRLYQGGIGEQYALRQSYFPLRQGGKVTLYQDAHVCEGVLPEIELDKGRRFKQGKCWEDICHAILDARRVVYVVGWSIYDQVRLVREPSKPLQEEEKSSLGELLNYKSLQEGVRVLLLVWDENVSIIGPIKTPKFMKTHAQETKLFFENSKVECVLAHRNQGGDPSFFEQTATNVIFSHHQKCVIVDTKEVDENKRRITAFIGGLDLCDGRYDTPEHRLYRDLDSVFEGDFHNPTFQAGTQAPRQPWHDLHCKIEGSAAYDVLTNFEQRWHEATGESIKTVLNDDDPSSWVLQEDGLECWNVQVFRSIDSGSIKEFDATQKEALFWEKKLVIDKSIQMAYIQAIRSAQHFIYIENQYFIGSQCPHRSMGGVNLIPLELALKIASKIKAKERFSVYVIIPMWPEGDPKSKPVQKILYLQWQTMQMMYQIIAREIKSSKLDNAHPTDYLNFYCLGNRDKPDDSSSSEENGDSAPSHKYRRFMIYVHSKGMIVDDAYVILGSANINHRSMTGSRDTEIAMGAYQPHYTWTTKKEHPRGQIYGYRKSLWAEHMGMVDGAIEDPETLDCVKYVNHVAEENWKRFIGEQFNELEGHILKYPVEVNGDGSIKAIHGHESFPDVGGPVLGVSRLYIPDIFVASPLPTD